MLAAFAKAFRVLGDEQYLSEAKRCRRFIQDRLTGPDGRLFVRWRDGEAAHPGQLADYAIVAWALLELYAAEYDGAVLE